MPAAEEATRPDIATVRALGERLSNWGRWGPDDQIGTLNLLDDETRAAAGSLIRTGRCVSLAIPFGEGGPQTGGYARFNPIHFMTRDGNDAIVGTTPRDFYNNVDGHLRSADDVVIMPLQSGTQWDGLSHCIYDDRIYNGYSADLVSSAGALKNDIAQIRDRVAGRGVLLDVARHLGVPWMEAGQRIEAEHLESCAAAQGVEPRRGDIILVRTGQMGQVKARGHWGDYAGGDAPGLALSTCEWFKRNETAAIAVDTWGMEVRPCETEDTFQPLHIVLLIYMGMTIGEIFDLEELAEVCAQEGRYEFFFAAPPIPFTKAVASPINPLAIL